MIIWAFLIFWTFFGGRRRSHHYDGCFLYKGFHSRPTKTPHEIAKYSTTDPLRCPLKSPLRRPLRRPLRPSPPVRRPFKTGYLRWGGRLNRRLSGRCSGRLSGCLSGHHSRPAWNPWRMLPADVLPVHLRLRAQAPDSKQ